MITIVHTGMGNVGSVQNMLRHIGADARITDDPEAIRSAEKLILPGVGAFDRGMQRIDELGIRSILEDKVLGAHTPILGICLGMQLLTRGSEEGSLPGLGWIDGRTVRFDASSTQTLKIPHMGWNGLSIHAQVPLLWQLPEEARFYFVHSYYVECDSSAQVAATTRYIVDFASVVAKGNIMGTQFHPEKSHRFGMQVLRNFANLECAC
jgi:glutamine amidotransferase